MATVFSSGAAERDVKRLPGKTRKSIRDEHVPRLSKNPREGKPLHGPLHGYFSYDFHSEGISYRIAYELINNDVIILMVDARDNFYKKLARRIR